MNWYLEVLRKYAVFSGRARRKEYWMFVLISTIISMALMIADIMLGFAKPQGSMGILGGIYTLLVLIPCLAVTVRRLHDTGHSGWTFLLGIIPIVGFILLYYMVSDSQPGANGYGPNPKETRMAMAA